MSGWTFTHIKPFMVPFDHAGVVEITRSGMPYLILWVGATQKQAEANGYHDQYIDALRKAKDSFFHIYSSAICFHDSQACKDLKDFV